MRVLRTGVRRSQNDNALLFKEVHYARVQHKKTGGTKEIQADRNPIGENQTTQYQIELDPAKMEQYHVSLAEITEKIEKNNLSAGGSMLSHGDLIYVIRGIGLVKGLEDMGNIVVKTENGVPVYLNDIGRLKYGTLERKGVLGFTDNERDYSDGVEGIVQTLRHQNPSQVLEGVKEAVDELNGETLPHGVSIHPFMDRTELVDTTLHTVSRTLLEGMVLVLLVLILFLGSWRGAVLVAVTIPFSLLIAFILMKITDIPANLLSLGGDRFRYNRRRSDCYDGQSSKNERAPPTKS